MHPMTTRPLPRLNTLLGDYPNTRAFRQGRLKPEHSVLDFADATPPHSAFKRAVRDMEFDICELAIVTFLMAKAHGKPLALMPAVIFGRLPHKFLMYNPERGQLSPRDLEGKRVAIRSSSVTTVTWLRGILQRDYGVDLAKVRWVAFEDAHVAEYRDPPNVERAPAGKTITDLLVSGDVDAGVVAEGAGSDARLRTLIPDADAAAAEWHRRTGVLPINHMVAVKSSVSHSHPEAVREFYRLLVESKRAAGLPVAGELDTSPMGLEANRRNLEVAIDYVYTQGLIPRRYPVDELFDDVTRTLGK
jgi:4,5-dihydroxyphthalate decarboxylase